MPSDVVSSSGSPLRICFVMLHYAETVDPTDLHGYLNRTPIHHALPRELAARGHQVDLVHTWPNDAFFSDHGARFHFVAEGRSSQAAAKTLGALRRGDAAHYRPAWRALRLIRSLEPDIVHFHGATLNVNLFLMLRALRDLRVPVVLHYHGGYPSRRSLARRLQRHNFARADRLCFSTASHATPFVDSGILRRPDCVVEIMETSSTFRPHDRDAARGLTGMTGDPIFVSVGRLHPIKDPFTMLRGFERALAELPRAELFLYYTSAELLPEVHDFLSRRPAMREHVHLRGRAAYEQMEAIYSSADILLQASTREFSGCAVLEAMACGVYPVVTDIPSFRAMTNGGRNGSLFPVGNAGALAGQILAMPRTPWPKLRDEIRGHFDRNLSFEHLAEQLEGVYRSVLAERTALVSSELAVT